MRKSGYFQKHPETGKWYALMAASTRSREASDMNTKWRQNPPLPLRPSTRIEPMFRKMLVPLLLMGCGLLAAAVAYQAISDLENRVHNIECETYRTDFNCTRE